VWTKLFYLYIVHSCTEYQIYYFYPNKPEQQNMLNQQIRDTILNIRDMLPAELNALLEQGAGEISALNIIERAKKAGDLLPEFHLTNQNGEQRNLENYLTRGPLVVTFYRGVWCPYCNLQLKAYADAITQIEATGATLVAISPESPDASTILKSGGAAPELVADLMGTPPFDILQDKGNKLATAMGLVFELPVAHQQLLKTLGLDVEAITGDTSFTFPDPATYVINPSGEITWAFVPNNYRKRAEVDQILSALNTLK
jgi:peroxiredoxin